MRVKNLFHLAIALIMVALFGGAMLFLQPTDAEAGIYSESSEVTYKEYWISHDEFTAGCDTTNGGKWYIEPDSTCSKTLDFSIADDISGATKVEIYIDLWRNRASPAAQFSLNGNSAHTPNVGDDRSRTPYVATLEDELLTGDNSITFSAIDGKAYHVHDVAFRVYGPISGTDTDDLAPTGALGTVTADNGQFDLIGGGANQTLLVDNDQLVLTATVTTADTKFVEFHAYYQGYDEDNDGDFQDWHNRGRNNWHPGGSASRPNPNPELGGTIDHVGTVAVNGAGVYTTTWDLPYIVNQSDVRFKIRLVDDAGNVRDAAGGQSSTFTLDRTGETAVFLIPNFQDIGLHRNSDSNTEPQAGAVDTISYFMQLPDDLSNYDTAYIIGSFYRNTRISINPSTPYVDNDSDFDFLAFSDSTPLQNGAWDLSIEEIPFGDLVAGENEIRFDYFGKGYGSFIEKPGPMIVLKGSTPLGVDNDAPLFSGHVPQAGATSVDADTSVQIQIFDPSGIEFDASLTMSINGSPVTPDILSGGPTTAVLTYTPASAFTAGDVISVSVHACDTLNNCATENYSFTVKIPPSGSDIQSDDFNVCALNTSIWTLEHQVAGFPPEFNGEQMLLSVPSGTGYNHANAPRIMQNVSNTDFEIEVKFDSPVNEDAQRQGILIEQDDDTYIQIEFLYVGNKTKISVQAHAFDPNDSHLPSKNGGPNTLSGPPWYIQVLRVGDTWKIRYSADGVVWKKATDSFDFVLDVNRVGVFIGNTGGDPAHTGIVDYFFNTFSPIDPEDDTALLLPTSVVGDGTVVPDVACGNPVSLTATADPGWSFSNWSGSPLAGSVDETNPNPSNIAFSNGDAVTAVFTRNEYTIDVDIVGESVRDGSVNGAGGVVSKDPEQSIYYYDDSVTLTATPDPGWLFTGWSGDLSGNNLSEIITVQASQNITATFTQQQYDVDAVVDIIGGSITISPASGPYVYGDSITLTAIPDDADWHFVNWSGDVSGTQNPYMTTVIAQNMTIDAVFDDTFELFLPLIVSE